MSQLRAEHQQLQDSLRAFVAREIAPCSAAWDRTGEFPRAALNAAAALGLCGIVISEDLGGAGMDYRSSALAIEELAAGDAALSTIISVANLVSALVANFGAPEQRAKYAAPAARGERLGCFCLTEPEAGSDAAALRTTARRTPNGGWCLNGVKQFITSGKEADFAVVFARSEGEGSDKKGISAFIVNTCHPGYRVLRIEDKTGQRASDTAQIALENCELSADALIGNPGEGYAMALANLEGGRINIAAQSVGIAKAAFDEARAYAAERRSFGKPLKQHQAVALKLAEMATRLEAARLLTWQAAELKDAAQPCLKQACMAKLYASETAEYVCTTALQILGGYGYTKDYSVEQRWRDARVTQIYEGASDIQRLVIARFV